MKGLGSNQKAVIFFDGVCGLCNQFVDFILKRDKKDLFLFSTLQGKTAQENGISLNISKSVVVLLNGKIYYKSTAALKAMARLGGGYKLLIVFIIVPSFIRNIVYDFIATNRYKWFGKQECRIPGPEERSKFLP